MTNIQHNLLHQIISALLKGLLLVAVLGFSTTANSAVELSFGVYTSDKPSSMVKQFRPILNSLEASLTMRLGEPVQIRMRVAKSYEAGMNDLVSGRVDFSRFGPASYILAKKQNPDISILAIEHRKGKKAFNGVICVGKDSRIQEVSELKGKRFAFGNERSTIGRYLSQDYLYQHGISARDLAAYAYLGRHDKVGTSVSVGSYDAGALKESTFKKLVKKGHALRSIARFHSVTKPWIARSGLPTRLRDALSASLIAFKDQKALKKLKKDGFLPGNDSDYAGIRTSMERNHRFFE